LRFVVLCGGSIGFFAVLLELPPPLAADKAVRWAVQFVLLRRPQVIVFQALILGMLGGWLLGGHLFSMLVLVAGLVTYRLRPFVWPRRLRRAASWIALASLPAALWPPLAGIAAVPEILVMLSAMRCFLLATTGWSALPVECKAVPDPLLRRANLRDYQAVLAYQRALFSPGTRWLHVLPYLLWGDSWVITRDNRVVAYALATRLGPGKVWIDWLAVSPGWTRQGLATTLLTHWSESLGLTVREDNDPALRCYERAGFQRSRRLVDYYGPGRSVVLMVRGSRVVSTSN
jgi:ribosomal protein S18 acetylase RimI-like enzyme